MEANPERTVSLLERADLHAALGEPHRLAIVDELALSDRSPSELGERCGLQANLLAHHLDILEGVGLIERFVSTGDRRRRYIRLRTEPLAFLSIGPSAPALNRFGSALFVCTHNSARSQLAAALWYQQTGNPGLSAGTEPADVVHPGAVAAAARFGIDISGERPRTLDSSIAADLMVTVCDRAHESLAPADDWLHWSIPDPAESGTNEAFDAAVLDLERRLRTITNSQSPPHLNNEEPLS